MTKKGFMKYAEIKVGHIYGCLTKAIDNGDVKNINEIYNEFPDETKDAITIDPSDVGGDNFQKLGFEHSQITPLLTWAVYSEYKGLNAQEKETVALNIVKKFLELGANINRGERDGDNFTALHYAIKGGYISVVKFLLENGASLIPEDEQESDDEDPLFGALNIAIRFSNKEMVKFLLENGANFEDWESEDPRLPLELALDCGQDIEMIDFLIEKGSDPQKPDQNGWTPAMRATVRGNEEVLKKLLGYNEDLKAQLEKGTKPMTIGIKLIKDLLSNKDPQSIRLGLGTDDLFKLVTQGHIDLLKIFKDKLSSAIQCVIKESSEKENYPILMALIAAQGDYKKIAHNPSYPQTADKVYSKLLNNFERILDELLKHSSSSDSSDNELRGTLPGDPLINLSATLSIFISFLSDENPSSLLNLSRNFLHYINKLNIKLAKDLEKIDRETDSETLSKKYYLMKLADQKFAELERNINTMVRKPEFSGLEETFSLLIKEIRGEENKYEINKNTGINLVRSTMQHLPYGYLMRNESDKTSVPELNETRAQETKGKSVQKSKKAPDPTKLILEFADLESGSSLNIAVGKKASAFCLPDGKQKYRTGEPELKKQNCSLQGYSDWTAAFGEGLEQGSVDLDQGDRGSASSAAMGECMKTCTEEY